MPKSLFNSTCLATFILAALPVAAFAADLTANSKIDAVTVFPDGAIVTRIAEIDLPQGETTLIFPDLPAALDMDSLRAQGEANARMSIGSVEGRLAPAATPDSAIDAKLKSLSAQRETVETKIAALDAKKAMITRFGQTGPEKLSPDSAPLDIGRWADAWEAVGGALDKVGSDLREARASMRDLDEQIRVLQQARVRPQPVGGPRRDVVIALETDNATKARVVLTYRVSGAGWRPLYDATLDTNSDRKAALQLVRRASVSQRTGEDWSGVSLSVSTVRSARGAAPPDVQSQRLAFWEPQLVGRSQSMPKAEARAAGTLAPGSADTAAAPPRPVPAPMQVAQEQEASIVGSPYQASFSVPGRVDARGDGTARSFRIGARSLPVDLTARAAPSLDPTAYLTAHFVNDEEAPLLPGEVSIHRDGMFIGKTNVGFIAPGDGVDLAFGADDRVKVTFVPVNRKENEPTWFGQTKTETREFKTTVRNLHGFPMPIKIVDRMPISENTAIVIDLLPATTPPTEKIVGDKRGVMGWSATLAPNESKDFRLAYRMKWPADRDVTFQTVQNGSALMR